MLANLGVSWISTCWIQGFLSTFVFVGSIQGNDDGQYNTISDMATAMLIWSLLALATHGGFVTQHINTDMKVKAL